MTALDAADLVLIAGRTLGIDAGAALAQMDIAVAHEALAEAWPSGTDLSDPGTAAAAAIGLVHALLRHRPFPRHGQQVAVAAGLQFLSLNGWRADLDPPATAAVVVEALASGQLPPGNAAGWLSPRLTPARDASRAPGSGARAPARAPLAHAGARRTQASAMRAQVGARRAGAPRVGRGQPPVTQAARAPGRRTVAGALLAVAVGGAALLAAACSRAPSVPAAPPSVVHTVNTGTSAPPPSAP